MAMKKESFNMGMPWESGYGYSEREGRRHDLRVWPGRP